MSNQSVTVTDQITVFELSISTWSGGVTLKPGELGVNLPSEAFTRGRKMLVNKAALNPALTLRRRAQERLLKLGTRFLGGYAIPKAHVDEAVQAVEDIRKEFYDFVDDFAQRLTDEVNDWVAQEWCTQEMEQAIRRSIPTGTEVRSRFEFEYACFDIKPAQNVEGNLNSHADRMGESILSEVSKVAERIFEDFTEASRNKEPRITRKMINGSIKGLRKKLYGLEFADKRIPPVRQEFDSVLSKLGDQGDATGDSLGELVSLLIILSDPDKMKKLGEGLLNREDFLPAKRQGDVASAIADIGDDDGVIEIEDDDEPTPDAPVSQAETKRVYVGF